MSANSDKLIIQFDLMKKLYKYPTISTGKYMERNYFSAYFTKTEFL